MGFLERLWGQSKPGPFAASVVRTMGQSDRFDGRLDPTPPFIDRRGALPPDGLILRGTGRVLVVADSHQKAALRRVASARTDAGVNIGVLTALVPEQTDPADPMAVAVQVGGVTVGQLSTADARAYRPALDRLTTDGRVAYCNATIQGGWGREGQDQGDLGMFLELASPTSLLLGG
jgi:hypothetical protein